MRRSALKHLIGWPIVVLGAAGCYGAMNLTPSDADIVLSRQLLDAPNPAERGTHRVARLYYGSGSDRHRPEYRDSVRITTQSVDASKLVSLGSSARERNGYWGFTPKEFPLNARVWYPDGEGPFPLVLVVHGNHNMRDFSDPGYEYLGQLLASRGIILASIDMNFINGGIRGENDGRGWLLLKHLQAWSGFNADRDNPFFERVDLERIALIGHSRGGEAVAHAAAFNRLSHYPDDASLEFDFDFGIRSIIAIAPVDGQYLPTGRYVPLENVSYMVFHGSHDGDVTSFHGLRQYHRLRFTDGVSRFKTAVYVYRANHGQWNSVWRNKDNGPRSGRRLDLRTLMPEADQRRFGEIYVSAFLEATLRDDERYLPMFRDHRVIGGWLPKTMYITRFESSTFRPVATFEEDIDVTTGSVAGVSLRGDSLSTWREGRLGLRSSNRPTTSASQDNQGVWLGWNNRVAGQGPEPTATPATFTIGLPDTLAQAWNLSRNSTLDLLLAPTGDEPGPRRAARDSSDADGRNGDSGPSETDRADDENDEKPPIDLSIEVVDSEGRRAAVPLGRYGAIRRPLEISIMRRKDQEEDRFASSSELVLQSYSILLADFVRENASLDVSRITTIRFRFDRAVAGTVVVDAVGFSEMDPGVSRVTGASSR